MKLTVTFSRSYDVDVPDRIWDSNSKNWATDLALEMFKQDDETGAAAPNLDNFSVKITSINRIEHAIRLTDVSVLGYNTGLSYIAEKINDYKWGYSSFEDVYKSICHILLYKEFKLNETEKSLYESYQNN